MSRWVGIATVVALVALTALGAVAWSNRSYIDSYVENDVGVPTETTPATVINVDDPPVVRLAVAGDVGTGGPEEYQTAAAMDVLDEQAQFDALLLLGDNIYESGDPTLVQERVFQPFGPVLDGDTKLISVLGNHDVADNNGPDQAEALGMPNLWYSTEIGDALIIALDSNQTGNADQLSWLETTLAGPRPAWTIVMLHHPAFSAGVHGNEPGVQIDFVPLFEKYGVDLVLAGHDHDYQRSNEINGITYVVTGAAAKLRPTGREDFTAVSWSTYSFVDLAIYPDRIEGQAVDHGGQAIDTFALSSAATGG